MSGTKQDELYIELLTLLNEHRLHKDHWAADLGGFKSLLMLRETWGGYVISAPQAQHPTLFGMAVEVDKSLPPGTIELRDKDGSVQGKIVNVT
jgi:hypothetical protein